MTAFQGKIQPIALSSSVQLALGKHLLSCTPQEACGVLLGAAAAGGMRINDYMPMRNVAPDPLHAFVPDPQEWVKALYLDPAPIGLFHSHPHSSPWPSTADIQGLPSLGAEFKVYLIGSPGSNGKEPPRLNGFYIDRQPGADGNPNHRLLHAPLYGLLR
ncbi:Mov34/MPN/PAD-1 family protein [Paenibacillus sp. HW567]|uniref:Mov34/MPN/PAD-1 family protein n=1 Tax=Paenibacillus sp. HW567 TaxID=1034769 RepID=UPI0003635332|nr:M67 family metallopeptidase [Paenibacillus sp. HW567]